LIAGHLLGWWILGRAFSPRLKARGEVMILQLLLAMRDYVPQRM
jgi:hypothetical protein